MWMWKTFCLSMPLPWASAPGSQGVSLGHSRSLRRGQLAKRNYPGRRFRRVHRADHVLRGVNRAWHRRSPRLVATNQITASKVLHPGVNRSLRRQPFLLNNSPRLLYYLETLPDVTSVFVAATLFPALAPVKN
ncbi:hypothetical protein BDW02DRAFT_432839 [Decorospora gaudefroyi]|uniref:Secreted protein n=1 Tax=Decorospora gaudefroyi TaxID=184978 RepID=A0A6A5KAX9_9PLEO|nr:hypothetical protein BDW02DRAFT_432839 [Decorospora gaudefroyi]